MTYKIRIKPRHEREAMVAQRSGNSEKFGEPIFDFRNEKFIPKEISLPVDVPVYRMGNCRAFSAQQTEIARKGLDKNFFAKGQELNDAQQTQHEILVKLARQGTESVTPIFSVLQEEGQRESILITSTGVVVNGNRHLAAMRELKAAGGKFDNVLCSVLSSDTTNDEIDDIEADLQARPQAKLDYDWISDARLIRRQVGKGRSSKEVAERLRRKRSEIDNVLNALDEADIYLSTWAEKPGEYELLQDGQQIFGDIPKAIAGKDDNLQNASRAIAWSIYDNRDQVGGRVYRLNPAFGRLAPKVLEILEGNIDSHSGGDQDQDDVDDDYTIDIDVGGEAKDYTSLIEALRDPDDEVVEALLDACETAIELDKGKKGERAALRALHDAHRKVASVDANTAGPSTMEPMLLQIDSIRKCLEGIENVIQARKRGG